MQQGSGLIVSVSGIRGIVGQGLTAETALAFATALGTCTQGGSIVVSRDGRPSGVTLGHAVLAGLLQAGCAVFDLAIAPTPTCGLAVRRLQAAGAVQITASHNPAEWNGLKLFGPDGAVLTADQGRQVQALFQSGNLRRHPWDRQGTLQDCPQAGGWHCDRVLELLDVARLRSRGLAVLVDANGGAGGPLAVRLLAALGCRVAAHHCAADGIFTHPPEPLAENLSAVLPLVPQAGAALGCVLDPDADRLAFIDETGRYLGEELTLALAVAHRLQQEKGPVVINMSTSRLVEDLARRHGVPCYRTAVGEAHVVARMKEVGALIGGEGNGGVIDPRVGWVRDPFLGMALVLESLAESGQQLSALVRSLPAYHIVKDKYAVPPERLASLLQTLEQRWPQAKANRLDGLRLDWDDRWLHVRPSNTEPIVRVIAEAAEAAQAEQLCRQVEGLLTG